MLTPASRLSLADLSAAGIRLRPVEAVTVARELINRCAHGELPGIPSPHVVRLTLDGEILIEGPVAAGATVHRAARLLESMLCSFDAPPELRAPGALRLVLARAEGTLDLPAYHTLESFLHALDRFAAPDASDVIRDLAAGWAAAVRNEEEGETAPAEEVVDTPDLAEHTVTVSDVRRARRATRLSLREVAHRSRIPVSMLRELEWGYLANWPSGQYGRTQLVRYARAAGLDDDVVVRALSPEFAAAGRPLDVEPVDVIPHEPLERTLVPVVPAPTFAMAATPHRRRAPWIAALAIPALLAIGVIPALWMSQSREPSANSEVVRNNAAATPNAPPAPTAHENRPAEPQPSAASVPQEAQRGRMAPAIIASGPPPAPRRTTLRDNAAYSPAFATVGSAMFYHTSTTGPSALMRADTDPSGAILRITRVVDGTSSNFHARPSPDGSRIAFDSDRDAQQDGERAVYVADADGQNVRRITGPGFAAVPSWSPDGRRLAYVREEEDASLHGVWNLWTVDLENGESTRLTSHRDGQTWGAAWFPDGRSIAYSHETQLVVRPLDGGRERIYRSPIKGRMLRTPAVSPDGRRIMFQVFKEGAWLLDLSDGSMRKVLSDPSAEEFTWSPDGQQVAYHSRQTGKWGVWVMAPR